MRRFATGVVLPAALALAGCSAAPNTPGLSALLRVAGAQFYPGAPPADQGGPKLVQMNASTSIYRGENDTSVGGLADPKTTGIALYLDKDVGYWVIAPTIPDPANDFALTFSAPMAFSSTLPEAAYTLVGQAIDLSGRTGPRFTAKLKVKDAGTPAPAATLLVSLRWDSEADLDLHLVTPDGTEIFSSKINSYTGPNTNPDDYKSGGILDFDSNSTCVIDGRRLENIYWTVAPPKGHYIARVETYSMCSEAQANWSLAVTAGESTIGAVNGVSRDNDTLAPRGKGAGVTALEFDIQ